MVSLLSRRGIPWETGVTGGVTFHLSLRHCSQTLPSPAAKDEVTQNEEQGRKHCPDPLPHKQCLQPKRCGIENSRTCGLEGLLEMQCSRAGTVA